MASTIRTVDAGNVLAHALAAFRDGEDQLPSVTLAGRLEAAHGDTYRGVTPQDLALALRRYDVSPIHVRAADERGGYQLMRGYRRSDLAAAIDRPAPEPYRPPLVERPWPVIDAACLACRRVTPILVAALYVVAIYALIVLVEWGPS